MNSAYSVAGEEDVDVPWHMGIYDAHCHPTDTPSMLQSIPSMKTTTLTMMSTRLDDQHLVAQVASLHSPKSNSNGMYTSKVIPSFGFHPWFSHLLWDDRTGDMESPNMKRLHYTRVIVPPPSDEFIDLLPRPVRLSKVLSQLRQHLEQFPQALVGEIGMDRGFRIPQPDENSFSNPRNGRQLSMHRVSMDHQKNIFVSQLDVAGEFGRAVSVHGVQCHGALFDTFRELWRGYEIPVERKKDKKRRRRKTESNEYEYIPDLADSEFEEDDQKSASHSELKYPPPGKRFPPRICLHSFSASSQTLSQYLKQPSPKSLFPSEIFFSFSTTINANLTRGHLNKIEETIGSVPDEYLLVESDYHAAGDELDDALKKAILQVTALKGWGLAHAVRRLGLNWERFVFGESRSAVSHTSE
ncbi:hypothetical protein EDC01DRAFT_718454 [Geopyxis carbonaria]|nr:hypothetical protein EDC01DRAFT_718454 [Geopyxis carbonaria]